MLSLKISDNSHKILKTTQVQILNDTGRRLALHEVLDYLIDDKIKNIDDIEPRKALIRKDKGTRKKTRPFPVDQDRTKAEEPKPEKSPIKKISEDHLHDLISQEFLDQIKAYCKRENLQHQAILWALKNEILPLNLVDERSMAQALISHINKKIEEYQTRK